MPDTERTTGPETLLSACLAGEAAPDGGWRVSAFHGTTHRFGSFGRIPEGDPTGAFGIVHYFSTSAADVRRNYTGDGADLAHRIDRMAAAEGSSRQAAAERLHGGCPSILSVEIAVRNPFFVDARDLVAQDSRFDPMNGGLATPEAPGSERRSPCLFPVLAGRLDADRARVLAESGHDEASLSKAAKADRETIEDLAFLAMEETREEHLGAIEAAFGRAARHLGLEAGPIPALPQAVAEAVESIDHGVFYAALLGSEDVQDLCLEDGSQVGGAFAGRVVEELGFDAIVMMRADRRWKGFEMEGGTAHLHVSEENARNIEITEIRRGAEIDAPPVERGRTARPGDADARRADRQARVAERAREMQARRATRRGREASAEAR